MGQTDKRVKSKSQLRKSQISIYIAMGVLGIMAAAMGCMCITFDHLFEGVIILASDISLMFITADLMHMDKVANQRAHMVAAGDISVEIKDASIRLDNGERDFGTCYICENGVAIDSDVYREIMIWSAIEMCRVANKYTIELILSNESICRVVCNSDIKVMAAVSAIKAHDVDVESDI